MELTGGEGQKCEGLSFDSNVPPDPEAVVLVLDLAEPLERDVVYSKGTVRDVALEIALQKSGDRF
jgi:hypothetical protein